jgi:type I site-specific restriction endonuclease
MEEEKTLHGIAHPAYELAAGRKTLVFAASVAHAERMCEIFNRHKIDCARWVCGKTNKDERRQMFADYAKGRFQILVNVGVATEGFDEPSIEVVALARPTKSRALYSQMVGRGTRPLAGVVDGVGAADLRRRAISESGKTCLEVIDCVGNSGRHKLISAADILGGKYTDEVIERATHNAQEKSKEGKPADVMEELNRASLQIREECERERRRHVVGVAEYSSTEINPFDLFDISPERERGWNKGRALTGKMAAMLARNGIDPSKLTYTHASQVIGEIINRPEILPCTPGQAKVLRRYGYKSNKYNKREASIIIDRLAANNWQRPPKEVTV